MLPSYTYNLDGTVGNLTSDCNRLTIVWSKDFNEISYHHAELMIKGEIGSLFAIPTARLEATECVRMIRNSAYIGASTVVKTGYLPFTNRDGFYHIAIDNVEILKILILNQWTKGKNGRKLQLKEFPTSLSIQVNEQSFDINFDIERGKTPYLMIEPQLEEMKDGDRLIQNIIF